MIPLGLLGRRRRKRRRERPTRGLTIHEIRAAAKKRGGECLAPHYRTEKLPFRCAEGHEWKATGSSILRGHWCPRCAGVIPPGEKLELIREFARKKGGELLESRFTSSKRPLAWRCAEGHVWKASWGNVGVGRDKTWCPHCAGVARHTLEDLHAAAAKRGGRCLAAEYGNTKAAVDWRCEFGHVWSAKPTSVLRRSWCPYCAGRVPLTLERIQFEARRRGGTCLSKSLPSAGATRVQLECGFGHRWKTRASSIASGHWCPTCGKRVPAGTAAASAERRGGQCLSREPSAVRGEHLGWRCLLGHHWTASLENVRAGHWCPACRKTSKIIETLRYIARFEGGRLISPRIVSRRAPLRWVCKARHEFEATALSVLRDDWCDRCPRSSRYRRRRHSCDGHRVRATTRGEDRSER